MGFGTQRSRLEFRKIKDIIPAIWSTTAGTADSTTLKCNSTVYNLYPYDNVTIQCLVGDIHIESPNVAATTNGFKLVTGAVLDVMMPETGYISFVSTSTLAMLQAIIWEG